MKVWKLPPDEQPSAVANRIRLEIARLDRLPPQISNNVALIRQVPEVEGAIIEAIALELHGAYVGIERILEAIARHIDRSVPAGGAWHQNLLARMTAEAESRPPVLDRQLAVALDRYLKFRHFVRTAYSRDLDPEIVLSLAQAYPPVYAAVRARLLDFAGLLDAASAP